MAAPAQRPPGPDRPDPTAPTLLVQVGDSSALLLVVAALRAGMLGDVGRTVLLHHSQAAVPEAARSLPETEGWERLTAGFDLVVDYDALVAPQHPLAWTPAPGPDSGRWAAALRSEVLPDDGPVRLLLTDLHLAPARTLAAAFPDAEIHVHAHDLTAWAPTPSVLEPGLAARVRQLVHADLWPGLAPLLLSETARTSAALPLERLRAVAAGLGPCPDLPDPGVPVGVVVEEDLLGLGLSEDEAAALAAEQIAVARRHGARRVVVVRDPVPALGVDTDLLVEAGAEELGVDTVPLAALQGLRPVVVVGCRSALLLSSGAPAVAVQPPDLLERLRPWAHPARVPLVLAHLRLGAPATTATTTTTAEGARPVPMVDRFGAQPLVDALAHAVQPRTQLRFAAQSRLLVEQQPALAERYYRPGNPLR